MKITVKTANLGKLSADLSERKSHIETAMRRATRWFIALLQSYVLEDVRKAVGLRREDMRQFRVKGKVVRNRLEASLWVGSNPVAVRHLNPRFGRGGVTAGTGPGRKTYPRAFMPFKKTGNPAILAREGKSRLPLIKPAVDINDIVISTLDKHWQKLEAYFDARVRAELAQMKS